MNMCLVELEGSTKTLQTVRTLVQSFAAGLVVR